MSCINNGATAIHPPRRTKAQVSDAAEIRDVLESAYGARLRLRENRTRGGNEELIHERIDVGPFAIDDIHLPGDAEFSPDPLGKVVATWANSGRLEGNCAGIKGEASAGELAMVSQPDLPHYAHAEELSATTLVMDPAVVAGVITGVPVCHAQSPVRFNDFRPVNPASAQLWIKTVSYVKSCVLADDALVTPLVIGHASRLLAAVTLLAFPSGAPVGASRFDRIDTKPALLRRAVEYMDRNVENDIALADIADAVHVTPRAVQYMFRKHLDTTPLHYLRRARLHRAHEDLVRSDKMHETVTAIAARWGFMHTGRFAVLYRDTYGRSPRATLGG
ncbi:AraC family transcriptional regulator [Mycobacteriaceae bacterium 1482268.1]|nr:AraC family transcriptional regulator [Mycobacteriaceae bacterium 1482268.1]